jgi:2-polyprenyl-3-methyl-5-hydroxy-6-metoxy-1,4-benzoquinol methylase
MRADDAAAQAAQRDRVRRGYDAIPVDDRSDDGQAAASSAEDVSRYAGWAAELADLLPAGAVVADLGCGIGLPATRELADHGLRVLGVDPARSLVKRRHRERCCPFGACAMAVRQALRVTRGGSLSRPPW